MWSSQLRDVPPHRVFARHFHGSVAEDNRLARQKAEMLPLVNDLCRRLGALVVACLSGLPARRSHTGRYAATRAACGPSVARPLLRQALRPLVTARAGCTKLSTVVVMHRYPWWFPSLFRVSDLLVRVTDESA